MNIFILDYNPKVCAQMHCDKHVVKMILETTQMLCTIHSSYGLEAGYKPTHLNHPCTIWARESKSNYLWLCELLTELHNEWQWRFNHQHNHKSYDISLQLNQEAILDLLPDIGLTPFAQAMPEQYRNEDSVKAYQDYYLGEKLDLLTYTNRKLPNFLLAFTLANYQDYAVYSTNTKAGFVSKIVKIK